MKKKNYGLEILHYLILVILLSLVGISGQYLLKLMEITVFLRIFLFYMVLISIVFIPADLLLHRWLKI